MKSLLEYKPEDVICTCMNVKYEELHTAIKKDKKQCLNELAESLGVGLGCASCTVVVQKILDNVLNS